MKMMRCAVLALLLISQAVAQELAFDPRLAVEVATPSGKVVEIKGPKVIQGENADLDFRWQSPVLLKNRDGKFTVVQYLGNKAPYWSAMVYLVHPNGEVQRLENDTVLDVRWTDDGKYLIGVGSNTLRLWNLNGGLRQVSYSDIRAFRYLQGKVCLNLSWYSPTTGQLSRTTEIKLAMPSLKQVSEKDTDGQETCKAQ